jgi:hypothetical protein
MNKTELRTRLLRAGVRPDSFSLDGGQPSEAYVLAQDGRRWRVYYSERGTESSVRHFDSEEAACEYFLERILGDKLTRT